jgi:hypothetical protein
MYFNGMVLPSFLRSVVNPCCPVGRQAEANRRPLDPALDVIRIAAQRRRNGSQAAMQCPRRPGHDHVGREHRSQRGDDIGVRRGRGKRFLGGKQHLTLGAGTGLRGTRVRPAHRGHQQRPAQRRSGHQGLSALDAR